MRAHLEGYYRALSQKPGSIPIPTSRSPKTLDLTPLVHRSPQVFVSPHPLLSAGAQCSPGGDSVAACVLGVCLWSRCPGLPPELGGQQVGPRGSHSSWEAPWSCPAPPLRPRLRLAPAAGPAAACQCGLAGLLLPGHGRLGPQCLLVVPGAAQEVGGEGQEATTAGEALGMGLCAGGSRAFTLFPCFLGAQMSLFVWLTLSPCLWVEGLSVHLWLLGPGLIRVGLCFPSALSRALSSLSAPPSALDSFCGSGASVCFQVESGIPSSPAQCFSGRQAVGRERTPDVLSRL